MQCDRFSFHLLDISHPWITETKNCILFGRELCCGVQPDVSLFSRQFLFPSSSNLPSNFCLQRLHIGLQTGTVFIRPLWLSLRCGFLPNTLRAFLAQFRSRVGQARSNSIPGLHLLTSGCRSSDIQLHCWPSARDRGGSFDRQGDRAHISLHIPSAHLSLHTDRIGLCAVSQTISKCVQDPNVSGDSQGKLRAQSCLRTALSCGRRCSEEICGKTHETNGGPPIVSSVFLASRTVTSPSSSHISDPRQILPAAPLANIHWWICLETVSLVSSPAPIVVIWKHQQPDESSDLLPPASLFLKLREFAADQIDSSTGFHWTQGSTCSLHPLSRLSIRVPQSCRRERCLSFLPSFKPCMAVLLVFSPCLADAMRSPKITAGRPHLVSVVRRIAMLPSERGLKHVGRFAAGLGSTSVLSICKADGSPTPLVSPRS